ncbi:uncharacterized protein LOC128180488 isoform X2 [Crassostrea angulata]|uniref:uncharacterized protein LOC128180488 isoform X2 n=1 Tax=Magallana angulata TaxID=2784310 RepID=UPI0022B119E8|nr:uncharacterized protein LOC128180488 isoform X2 [Crassostrea angulata]
MDVLMLLLLVAATLAETNTGSCKDMLQGYMTGQLSSALGAYQVEALRREFKSFSDVIEKSINEFKENIKSEVKTRLTGGSHFNHKGAAVEPLCLPRDPEWGMYTDGYDGDKNYVYGAEYETQTFKGNIKTVHNHDVPCAVCLVRRKSVVQMFPARKTCFKGWTLEYHGYLMAGHHNHAAGTSYTCVDSHPDTLHGGSSDKDGRLFYLVEAACGSLKCPPFVSGKELVCAVCSKE